MNDPNFAGVVFEELNETLGGKPFKYAKSSAETAKKSVIRHMAAYRSGKYKQVIEADAFREMFDLMAKAGHELAEVFPMTLLTNY